MQSNINKEFILHFIFFIFFIIFKKEHYCSICCKESFFNDDAGKHNCEKSCSTQIQPEDDVKYFEKCWNPKAQNNSHTFCDLKFAGKDNLSKTTCKKDFCMMCCNVRDVMFNKVHTTESIMGCSKKCAEKFNTDEK